MTPPDASDLSIVIPTYNRAAQLRELLAALARQDARGIRYDIVVVDNGSVDDPEAVVREASAGAPHLRVLFRREPRRGVSYARNTGIAHSAAPIVAFLDDDGIPGPHWVRDVIQAFDDFPEADCIGGRLLPRWAAPPPEWITPSHWGAIALQDRGRPLWLGADSASSCLLTANVACRRDAIDLVGGFSPDYPRCQDREFEMRLWRAGKRGLFLPGLDVTVEVPAERLTKSYHRRWHRTTAHYHALMRYRDTVDQYGRLIPEDTTSRRFLGTPLFLYREGLAHLRGWLDAAVRRDATRRFFHETRLWYLASFVATRFRTDVALPWRRSRAAAPAHVPKPEGTGAYRHVTPAYGRVTTPASTAQLAVQAAPGSQLNQPVAHE